MSLLKFLNSSTVEEVKSAPRSGGGARKERNPAPSIVAIRVWKDGSIFPSQAAVDKFSLEYKNTTIEKVPIKLKEGETAADQKYRNEYKFPQGTGNGFDMIDSRLWNEVKGEGAMLFVAVVPKDAGKVDMFNTVAYSEDGTPKVSVMEQGAATFGEEVLIPALEAVYGIKFNRSEKKDEGGKVIQKEVTDGVDFIDLAIFESLGDFNVTEKYSKPIVFAPKRITRGKDKGKADYERRENVKVYGLAPASEVIPAAVSGGADQANVQQGPKAEVAQA